jgi:branched-chain amino acid transport system permease protein
MHDSAPTATGPRWLPSGPLLGVGALAVLVVLLHLGCVALGKPFYLTQLTMAAYYSIVALGLCLLMGYAGQVSLGHAAFFGIGGYTTAILTGLRCGAPGADGVAGALGRLGLLLERRDLYTGEAFLSPTPWLGLAAAVLLSAGVALIIGYPALRLKGHYLAMATLGFGLIVYRLVLGSDFTGAADGVTGVPPWRVLPGVTLCSRAAERVPNYYFACGLLLLALLLLLNVVRSRAGRALRAIHGSEAAANAMGVHTAGYKLRTFVFSAVLAAVAGCFFTHYTGGVGPSETGVMKSVRYVALVAAGGMASLWGVLTVSTVLTFLSLRGWFGTLDHGVFGALLIAIMTLAPAGPLVPLRNLLLRPWRRRRAPTGAGPGEAPGGAADD